MITTVREEGANLKIKIHSLRRGPITRHDQQPQRGEDSRAAGFLDGGFQGHTKMLSVNLTGESSKLNSVKRPHLQDRCRFGTPIDA
jgi:hypothetical protein